MWTNALVCALLLTAASQTPKEENRWEKDICAFEQQDQSAPPPAGAILFVGSSSIRMWDLGKSFPGMPALNRGFGGSQVADVNLYFDRVVKPYSPRTIVFYSGDNDLASGKEPQTVIEDFRTFLARTHAAFPEARIIVMSLRPTTARWNLFEKQTQVNDALAAMAKEDAKVTFVNCNDILLDASGKPKEEFLAKDKLHLNEAGYVAWTAKVQPLLEATKQQ